MIEQFDYILDENNIATEVEAMKIVNETSDMWEYLMKHKDELTQDQFDRLMAKRREMEDAVNLGRFKNAQESKNDDTLNKVAYFVERRSIIFNRKRIYWNC